MKGWAMVIKSRILSPNRQMPLTLSSQMTCMSGAQAADVLRDVHCYSHGIREDLWLYCTKWKAISGEGRSQWPRAGLRLQLPAADVGEQPGPGDGGTSAKDDSLT